jgi:hypothetical protein
MQLCLFECTLADWLIYVFCMARITFGGSVIPWSVHHDLLLSMPSMKRKISCIVHKGEKQIQILDGY